MDRYILSCRCGCGNALEFVSDGELYVSALSSSFYTAQIGVVSRLKETLRLLFSRDKHLNAEVIVSREDLIELCDFLEKAGISSVKPTSNVSNIKVSRLDEQYCLNLYLDMPPLEILKGHAFRGYELVLNKRHVSNLLVRIRKCLKQAENAK